MAKKGVMPNFATVDDYISAQSKEAQTLLNELRDLIKETVPEVTEIPNYKVPSFTLVQGTKSDQQIMIAAYAKHVSFYPFESTTNHFSEELKPFDTGKGSIKFPFNKMLPNALIKKMILFRKDEIIASLD